MPTREDMRSLGQEIVRSYEDRIAGIAQTKSDVAQIKSDTSAMLKGFHRAHAAMSKEMRANLAKSTARLKRDVSTMLKRFDAELKKVRTELAGAHDEWQKLGATMQARRAGKPPKAAAPPSGEE